MSLRGRHFGRLLLLVVSLVSARPAVAQVAGTCPLCEQGAELIATFQLVAMDQPMRDRPGWTPPRRIVVAAGGEPMAAALRSVAPGAEVVTVTPGEVASVIGDADVLIGWCTPEIIAAARSLRWIQLPSAGAETCTGVPAVAERNIVVTNAQRIHGRQVAEHALALMLSLSRKLHTFRDHQRTGRFEGVGAGYAQRLDLFELDGRTLLVAGLGGIGTELARRAHALGMRVIATRNSSRKRPDFVEYVGLAPELHTLAARADFVVSAVPLTETTRGMYDAAFFQTMKPGAWFINVGRGESVVTGDLVAALREGRIAGAALDVTDPEPLPAGHPLWSMENVVLTPHIAADSEELFARVTVLAAENLRRYVAGERLVSVVDLQRGY